MADGVILPADRIAHCVSAAVALMPIEVMGIPGRMRPRQLDQRRRGVQRQLGAGDFGFRRRDPAFSDPSRARVRRGDVQRLTGPLQQGFGGMQADDRAADLGRRQRLLRRIRIGRLWRRARSLPHPKLEIGKRAGGEGESCRQMPPCNV